MIKVLFFIENLHSGGAERVLRNLVNTMDQKRFDMLNRIEAWLGLTYWFHIRDNYDIECAYLECFPTKIIASSTNRRAKKLAWVHCDLQKKMKQMRDPQKFKVIAKKWYQKFDRIVCVSEDVRDSFAALFGDAEKTTVLYNTIDDEAIRQKAEATIPELPEKHRSVVVSLGRLTAQKGYDRLLRVHKRLIDAGIDCDLYILGEGEARSKLETYIKETGLSDSVTLPGFFSNPYPYIKFADLLVCSSRYEGFSTFVTEGMILGKPVVTTDCTGMRELLGDSQFGLIVDNSEDGLYDGMMRLLKDRSMLEYYARQAMARGESFSARQLAEKTEQFLLHVFEDR